MKIKTLKLENFRSKEQLDIQFGEKLTLLVGENGSGKTSVLDAVAISLGAVLSYLPDVSGISFRKYDIRQKDNQLAPYTRVEIETTEGLKWGRTLRRDKSKKTIAYIRTATGLQYLRKYLDATIIDPFNEGTPFILPVFSYYGVSRALLEVPMRRRGFPKAHKRFEALGNALNSVSRFKSAFVWFYNKEIEEQQIQKELRDFDYRLPELEVVRQAIIKVFPDISEPHIKFRPFRFAVKKDDEELDITQLSDGYKTLLSLVIDLASRMALANPEMTNPLDSPAVVLIDEIDLHLHPEWQRRVIGDLLSAFSNTQFILTTHSPYIVASANNHLMRNHIRNLEFSDDDLKNIIPLSAKEVAAYFITNEEEINLMDAEVQLLDDKLIHPFNAISEVYEKMRDIQWENRKDD